MNDIKKGKQCALSFFADSKMDATKTMITVLFIMFPMLIKVQQALNLQGNIAYDHENR